MWPCVCVLSEECVIGIPPERNDFALPLNIVPDGEFMRYLLHPTCVNDVGKVVALVVRSAHSHPPRGRTVRLGQARGTPLRSWLAFFRGVVRTGAYAPHVPSHASGQEWLA